MPWFRFECRYGAVGHPSTRIRYVWVEDPTEAKKADLLDQLEYDLTLLNPRSTLTAVDGLPHNVKVKKTHEALEMIVRLRQTLTGLACTQVVDGPEEKG